MRGALWGDLTARVAWHGTPDDAFAAARDWLGCQVRIFSPDGLQQWEGLIWSVRFTIGRRARARSLEGYANTIRVLYRTADFATDPPSDLGPATPIVSEDTALQATDGRIEEQISAGPLYYQAAVNTGNDTLSRRKRLLWLPETGTLGGGAAQIELECYGFWRTLFYQAYTSSTTGTAEVKTIIQNILAAKAPFVSTNYDQMAATGFQAEQYFDIYEYPGDLIKELLRRAEGYTFRLGPGRVPILKQTNRLSTTVDYTEDLAGVVRSAAGADVPTWEIKPDTILRQEDFAPPSLVSAAAIDEIQNVYLYETTWRNGEVSYRAAVPGVLGEVLA